MRLKNSNIIGSIRKVELRDVLVGLAIARPDLREAIWIIAIQTGLARPEIKMRNNEIESEVKCEG